MRVTSAPAGAEAWACEVSTQADRPEVANYMKAKLGHCGSDKDAFDWALALRQSGAKNWEVVHDLLRDPEPPKRAIAVRMLGWSGTDCERDLRHVSLCDTNAYVRQAASDALEDWWKEQWAKHWYGQIFKAGTEPEGWGAQELCRSVADRRLMLWRDELERGINVDHAAWRRRYLVAKLVDRRLGETWERRLEDRAFGQDISFFRHDI